MKNFSTMKKVIFLSFILFAISLQAQSSFGIKGGLTYNADAGLLKTVDATYEDKGKNSAGYHLGIFKKINLGGLYLQPELWYVSYKSEFKNNNNTSFDIEYKRMEIPVSLGTNVLKVFRVQGGPVVSYYFDDAIDLDEISEIKQEDLAIGFQVGAGVDIDNFSIDVRYDFPFGDRETEWIGENNIKFEAGNTPKLLHVSLGYSF